VVGGVLAAAGPAAAQDGGVVHEDFKLTAGDAAAGDGFGWDVAVDGGVVAVGAAYKDGSQTESGAVYLFDAGTGEQTAALRAADSELRERFGGAVDLDGGVLVVGTLGNALHLSTRAEAFVYRAGTGEEIGRLLPEDDADRDGYGWAVAIDGDSVVVGAFSDDTPNGSNSGSVYSFSSRHGKQRSKLIASDGERNDEFGYAVAMDGGLIAVGAKGVDGDHSGSGAVFLFRERPGREVMRLVAPDESWAAKFGNAVALDGGLLAVGAPGDSELGAKSGAVYVYDAETGELLRKIVTSDGGEGDNFGYSVAMEGGVIAAGAVWDGDNGVHSGSAYLFDAQTGEPIAKLLASDGAAEDRFGTSIDIDGGVVVVGARDDDDAGEGSGSAYVFRLSGLLCPADLDGDGRVDGRDVRLFVRLVLAHDPAADLDGDGVVTFGDLVEFVHGFRDGCP